MKRYPVAMIPYANMAPFRQMGPPEKCRFVECVPRVSIEALREERVLAAAVPVGGLGYLTDVVEPLGPYGIAVQSNSMSVLLFSDRPFEQFRAPLTIGLTGESASSVRLLYLLLGLQHGFDAVPLLTAEGRPGNGYLVIGDRALKWAHEFGQTGAVQGYSHVTDLAVLWHRHYRLPFVFARWVVHRNAPAELKGLLQQWLRQFSARENQLVEASVPGVAAQLELPQDEVRRYLRVIRRCLTLEDDAGQQRFMAELRRHGQGVLFKQAGEADDGSAGKEPSL
jgi:predicted solute-binding protein